MSTGLWRYVMKKMVLRRVFSVVVMFAMIAGILFLPTSGSAMTYSSEFGLTNTADIQMDGSFDDWEDIPVSYEYNWDNSGNCWYWGVWVDGVCYKTEEGTYDTNVRHAMQLYSDGACVYLHITFSRDYGAKFNGNDYQFYIDGEMAAFQVTDENGNELTGAVAGWEPGVYTVQVRHRAGSVSSELAVCGEACIAVKEGGINNEIELKIYCEDFQYQNSNITFDNVSVIEFFTPNLMYRRITAAGVSTYGAPLAIACAGLCVTGVVINLRKRKEEDGILL